MSSLRTSDRSQRRASDRPHTSARVGVGPVAVAGASPRPSGPWPVPIAKSQTANKSLGPSYCISYATFTVCSSRPVVETGVTGILLFRMIYPVYCQKMLLTHQPATRHARPQTQIRQRQRHGHGPRRGAITRIRHTASNETELNIQPNYMPLYKYNIEKKLRSGLCTRRPNRKPKRQTTLHVPC